MDALEGKLDTRDPWRLFSLALLSFIAGGLVVLVGAAFRLCLLRADGTQNLDKKIENLLRQAVA